MKAPIFYINYTEINAKKLTHTMSSVKKPSNKKKHITEYNVLQGNYWFQNENTIANNSDVYWQYIMVARHTAPFCK